MLDPQDIQKLTELFVTENDVHFMKEGLVDLKLSLKNLILS